MSEKFFSVIPVKAEILLTKGKNCLKKTILIIKRADQARNDKSIFFRTFWTAPYENLAFFPSVLQVKPFMLS